MPTPSTQLDPSVTPTPRVGFKLGTQTAMNSLLTKGTAANAIHGTFYLTQDTHRLYVGNYDGSISPVNQGIRTVSAVSNLPSPITAAEVGNFYYAENEHVLCIASVDNSGSYTWVQINPDTYVTDFSIGMYAVNATHPTGSMSTTNTTVVRENETTHVDEDIALSNRPTATVNYVLRQSTDAANSPTAAGSIKFISGSDGLIIEQSKTGDAIILSCKDGDTYTLALSNHQTGNTTDGVHVQLQTTAGTPAGSFDLLDSTDNTLRPRYDSTTGAITLEGGLGDISVAIAQGSGADSTKIIVNLTDDSNYLKKELKFTPQIRLVDDPSAQSPVVSATSVGTFTNATGSGNAIDYSQGTLNFDLPVYTRTEVDNLIKTATNGIDALYFAGTIGQNGTYSNVSGLKRLINGTDKVSNGATYKITTADNDVVGTLGANSGVNIAGVTGNNEKNSLQVGDLIIVKGVEYQNETPSATLPNNNSISTWSNDPNVVGTLVKESIEFVYVPSGDDTDIFYQPNVNYADGTNTGSIKFGLKGNFDTTAQGAEIYTLNIAQGNATSGNASATQPTITESHSGYTKTIYIDHAIIPAPTSSGSTTWTTGAKVAAAVGDPNATLSGTADLDYYAPTFTAITAIELVNGHVKNFQTTKFSVTPNSVSDFTTTISALTVSGGTGVELVPNVTMANGDALVTNNNVEITSTSLNIARTAQGSQSTDSGFSIDLVWGAFTGTAG